MDETQRQTECLIRLAHDDDREALGLLLEAHRATLRMLAERRLGGRIGARVGASDVVQLTFLEAHKDFGKFRGERPAELVAWLERILDNNIMAAVRDHALAQKRNLRRERSLDTTFQGGTENGFLAGLSSPSQCVMRKESEDRLEKALLTLPPDQRKAVRMRHLENRSLADIATQLGRSPAATAGLIKRGIHTLRSLLHDQG